MDKRIENHIIQQYYDNQNLYRSLKHDITDIIETVSYTHLRAHET